MSDADLSRLPGADLQFVPPMLAKLEGRLPEGWKWLYELFLLMRAFSQKSIKPRISGDAG
jgi:hypothetical protein